MNGFFSVPKDLVKEADEQTTGFKGLESAVYKAQIVAAYIVESGSSDSKALTIQYKVKDNERIFYESLWYQEGRGLNTYHKDGKEILLPSFTQMLDFFAVAGVDIDTSAPEELIIKHFGAEAKYPVFKEFTGKVIELGIRHLIKDDYKDTTQVDDTQTIQLFIGEDDKTGGEIRGAKNAYTKAGWLKTIAKKPTIDQRKDSKDGAVAEAGSDAPVAKVSSW